MRHYQESHSGAQIKDGTLKVPDRPIVTQKSRWDFRWISLNSFTAADGILKFAECLKATQNCRWDYYWKSQTSGWDLLFPTLSHLCSSLQMRLLLKFPQEGWEDRQTLNIQTLKPNLKNPIIVSHFMMGELLSQNQRWDTFQLSHANSHSHRWVLRIICETMAIEDGSHSWDGNLFIPLLAHVCTWEHPIGGLENYWWDISFCPIKMSPFANTRAILGTEWEHGDQDETVLGLFLIPAVLVYTRPTKPPM